MRVVIVRLDYLYAHSIKLSHAPNALFIQLLLTAYTVVSSGVVDGCSLCTAGGIVRTSQCRETYLPRGK